MRLLVKNIARIVGIESTGRLRCCGADMNKLGMLDDAWIVLGGFMGQLANGISWLSWLNFGQSFGLDSPLVINFGILVITLGLTIKITMASIIGIAIALIIYRMI